MWLHCLQEQEEKEAPAPPPPRDTPAGDMQPALAAQQAGTGAGEARQEAVAGGQGEPAAAAAVEAPQEPGSPGEQQRGASSKRGGRIVAS